jgi:alanine racemase
MDFYASRAWAEINLDAIAHNVREIRRITNKRADIMAIVKADGYGHGVLQTVKTLLDNGVTRLAVSMLDEAIQLRNFGIDVPILVLSYTDPSRADEVISNNITQTVFSHDLAMALSSEAAASHRYAKIHIKVDTGMTRVGFMPGYSAVKNVIEISKLPGIIVEGLFTHYASADEKDSSYTYMQFEKYMSICTELERVGVHIPVKHVCNSAAIIEHPEMHLNMVRPGIILYGLYPSTDVNREKVRLKPAMTLKASISMVKDVDKDVCISYGRTFKTKRYSKIATIPIGYADGYTRFLSNQGEVLVNGQRAPIVGRVCMDQCMVDITDIKGEVRAGDHVVLFGRQGKEEISVDELAAKIGTINYEIVCVIGKRVPRVYLKDGKVCDVLNYLL